MSMQSVLGVVGGIVGSFFGYPQLGFVVGSLVGGLLTPKENTEGPRLDDLKVQVSTYGSGIPILYGTERAGGNVVWSTDKIETETTQEVGKGGGAENTTYRYFVHMRVVLCEKPRDGSDVQIVQIFQDGKLQWDQRSGIPIASALASEENLFAFFTLYQGNADQLPDAIEELYEGGAGSVPAYRGVVSIAMRAIECPGGRVPQYSFVLSSAATLSTVVEDFATITQTDRPDYRSIINKDGVWQYGTQDGSTSTEVWFATLDAPNKYGVIPVPSTGSARGSLVPMSGGPDPQAIRWVTDGNTGSEPTYLEVFDLKTGTTRTITEYIPGNTNRIIQPDFAAFDPTSGLIAVASDFGEFANQPIIFDDQVRIEVEEIPGLLDIAFYNQILYVLRNNGTLAEVRMYDKTGAYIGTIVGTDYDRAGETNRSKIRVDSAGVYVMLNLSDIGLTTNFYKVTTEWILQATTTGLGSDGKFDNYYCTDTYAVIGRTELGSNQSLYQVVFYQKFVTSEVLVKDIIADQCQRAGEFRYDVSNVPEDDTLHGYKIQNPASARTNIDPLFTAFAIYAVEEDGLIKFRKYANITSAATIAFDELAQTEEGSETPDAMPLNRAQELDLPRSVSISYVEETFDYQTATEKATRQITESNEDLIIELPIATNSDHAASVAQMVLYARWRQQNTRSLKVSRKYAHVSPGDGATVEYPRGTWRLWRVMNTNDTGVLCEWSVEPGDAELYTHSAIGATGYVRQEVAPLAPPTRALILDMPILRDDDDNAGPYVAFDSFAAVPAQAELFVGDNDATLASVGTISASAPIGFTEGILGGAPSTRVDETNLVTVNIGDDEFFNVTRDELLAGRGAYWAMGAPGRWEIGASALGDDLGDGRYILSRHLRGQFGTERFTDTHQANDTFVLLRPVGMLRPNTTVGSIGQSKSYRAVTKGRSFDSAASQVYANAGEGLMPLSPINLRRAKDAATNEVTLSWDRRSRLSMNFATGAVPLGEATEAYRIRVFSSNTFGTVVGTFASVTPSLTLSSAQQTAMGLTPGAAMSFEVAQVSESVGPGHETQATI